MVNDKQISIVFYNAINEFFQKEYENILCDIAERNLCGRLAIYLTTELDNNKIAGYYADPEYNRKQGGLVKTILDDETNVIKIQCDLIVHSRGNIKKLDNLIAIEMKKSTRPEAEKISDRKRLRAMTKESYDNIWSADGETLPEHVCGYILGAYMLLDISGKTCTLEYYSKGNKIDEQIINFSVL